MSFIAHTAADIAEMLAAVDCKTIEDLFIEIPDGLKTTKIQGIPARLTEMEVYKLLQQRARKDAYNLNFIGAGCYEHYIPAAVWELATRGEFLTSYTPYQAEASQGTLQLLYEFQTMLANLTGLDAANASMYDGATALAEAVLMAVRSCKKTNAHTVLMPKTVHPFYREVVATITAPQNINIVELEYDLQSGATKLQQLQDHNLDNVAALVIPQPNFFGILEDVNYLADWAHNNKILAIGLVNPMSLGLLQAPGNWGASGVDIACGEAQSLGVPLASGGPYVGFLCCKMDYIRQLPGRIVGMTTDVNGKRGFTLTLQPREQHIRRSKATSNICTNQGLLATAVTIYLSIMGAAGIKQVALKAHANTALLKQELQKCSGIKVLFNSPFLYEIVVQFSQPVQDVIDKLAAKGIQAGFNLTQHYPELKNVLLCCVTETKSNADIKKFAEELATC